ncbi:MAG: hypothetical protein AB7K24_06460 [Gemmataceae bacterium]
MQDRFTFGQMRTVLTELGFVEVRRSNGIALKHAKSNTVLLFRPYEDSDPLQPAEVFVVAKQLDERGLLERESLEALLSQTPAG